MARRRPAHEFVHMPVGRFQWEQLVRRAELDPSTKYVAGWFATWASDDGGDLIAGERLVADALGRNERFVREHLAALRELGLIELLLEAAPGRSAEYQLTFPGDGFPRIPMRLDPKNNRLAERPAGRMGSRRPAKNTGTRAPVNNSMTGTPVPVNGADDRHPSAADPDNTGTRAHDDRHPGAASPAPGRRFTGTRVPPTNTGPEHTSTGPLPPASDLTPTSTTRDSEPANTNQPSQRAPTDDDLKTSYRNARRILDAGRADAKPALDLAFAQAAQELADLGILDVRQRTIRAAALLEDWHAHGYVATQEGPEP